MTTRITTTWLPTILAAGAAGMLLPSGVARAQCAPDDDICVEVDTGGSVDTGQRPRSQDSQVIVVEEQAPAQPPQSEAQPPRVIIVETERESEPPPQSEPPPPPPPEPIHDPEWDDEPPPFDLEEPRFGIHGYIAGLGAGNVEMGGFGAAFRFRPIPHIGVDLGIGFFAGRDYNNMDRIEVPFTADLLIFVNPYSRLQFYFVAGVGVSFARAEGFHAHTGSYGERELAHAGGQAGAGLEWRISRGFALNGDLRVFLRQRVDSDDRPEFVEDGPDGLRTTDTSAGVVGRLGATFYF
jgi:hypothetical protein